MKVGRYEGTTSSRMAPNEQPGATPRTPMSCTTFGACCWRLTSTAFLPSGTDPAPLRPIPDGCATVEPGFGMPPDMPKAALDRVLENLERDIEREVATLGKRSQAP